MRVFFFFFLHLGLNFAALITRRSDYRPHRHIRQSDRNTGRVSWRHLLCSSQDLNQEPKSTSQLSEHIWCNAITKVNKRKILNGYAVTWPRFQLSLLLLVTDVRVGLDFWNKRIWRGCRQSSGHWSWHTATVYPNISDVSAKRSSGNRLSGGVLSMSKGSELRKK